MDLINNIKEHYYNHWNEFYEFKMNSGSISKLTTDFRVLKFRPTEKRNAWTYATCGMSEDNNKQGLELFIIAPTKNDFLIELLTAISHYHMTGNTLGPGHTVNFGYPWYIGSKCEYGLISLPYLDGPDLEWLRTNSKDVRFLWLIPITKDEVQYKKIYGIESLESLFENSSFNYMDPFRESVISDSLPSK